MKNNIALFVKIVILLVLGCILNVMCLFIVHYGMEVLELPGWVMMCSVGILSIITMVGFYKLANEAWWTWYINS
jgi:hypothetical protein